MEEENVLFKNVQQARVFQFFLLMLIMLPAAVLAATEPIALQDQQMPFTPKEFYIADILDERKDKQAVAWLLSAAHPIDLEGGGLNAIRQFIGKSLPANTTFRPVSIHLRECSVKETAGADGLVEGKVVVDMAFYLKGAEEAVHLLDYRGGAQYTRSATHQRVVEPALRQSLVSALKYFNSWMEQEAGTNVKLAKGVKVFFSDYSKNVEEDSVFYAPDRPLVWDDFRSGQRKSDNAAAIFSSFKYEGHSEVVDGFIHLHLNMKVFMLKNSSWVTAPARNDYGLNHEQRHFDIVKLAVEHFKKKILSTSLGVKDYDGVIGYEYIQAYREMNKLQDAYDGETSHGMDQAAQERWNKRIEKELRDLGLKE